MPYTVASPRPVPFSALVVKNGSQIRAIVAASMPQPVSLTASSTCGPGFGVVVGVGFVQLGVAHLDGELAALGHGVAGVDRQVEQHLLDVAGVGLDRPQLRVGHGDQLDVLADDAAEHPVHVRHHGPQVEDLRLHDGLAAEGQELAGQGRGPVPGGGHLPDQLAAGVTGREAAQQQFAVAVDDGEEVVEVVGDAAGQPADRLHLLRLAELLFELVALADVHEGQHGADDAPLAEDGLRPVLDREAGAVGPPEHLVGHVNAFAALNRPAVAALLERVRDAVRVTVVGQRAEAFAEDLARVRVAQEADAGLVAKRAVALLVHPQIAWPVESNTSRMRSSLSLSASSARLRSPTSRSSSAALRSTSR
jgi:hypothetical protein